MTDGPKTGESRSQEIRRKYRKDNGWHTLNNSLLSHQNDPNQLMGAVSDMQVAVDEAQNVFQEADKALADAQGARLSAEEHLRRIQTELDIRKLALAELLDIPG